MQRLFMCLGLLGISSALLQPTDSWADSCALYHKRASVKGVCGRVVNIAAQRVNDGEITLTGEGDLVLFRTKSDSQGSFSFDSIPEGNYTLHIKATGYKEAQRDLRVTRSGAKKCKPKIYIKLGIRICDTSTYIKGIDKPSDLDADFLN